MHPAGDPAISANSRLAPAPGRAAWKAIVLYLALLATSNLIWELAQLPLYSVSTDQSLPVAVLAAVHCTGGDVLIGAGSLGLAWLLFGGGRWPPRRAAAVAVAAVLAGLVYTTFSEWLNTQVLGNWAYSPLMPVLPVSGIGLTPLLQWLLLPPLCLRASALLRRPP